MIRRLIPVLIGMYAGGITVISCIGHSICGSLTVADFMFALAWPYVFGCYMWRVLVG
jgi:hypothetical protein